MSHIVVSETCIKRPQECDCDTCATFNGFFLWFRAPLNIRCKHDVVRSRAETMKSSNMRKETKTIKMCTFVRRLSGKCA